jgi:hypothetical protein
MAVYAVAFWLLGVSLDLYRIHVATPTEFDEFTRFRARIALGLSYSLFLASSGYLLYAPCRFVVIGWLPIGLMLFVYLLLKLVLQLFFLWVR